MSDSKRLRCNKCGELSYNGEWKNERWFCSDCLEYHRISNADTKGSKRKVPDKKVLDLIPKKNAFEELLDKARSAPRMPDYSKQIKRNGVTRVMPRFEHNSIVVSGSSLKQHYYKMLENKTLKDDRELMDNIINFRDRFLKHRISGDISLYGNIGVVARLKVYKILIEHGQEVVDYWIGKSIDPSSFNTLIHEFQIYLSLKHSTGNVSVVQYPTKWETIKAVDTDFEFS